MDRTYKEDIPAAMRALDQLASDFADLDSKTDWWNLRVRPLLMHAQALDGLLRSPRFAGETLRLTRGVTMFHSDLVYFRLNIKALKAILELERKAAKNRKNKPPTRPKR